MKEGDLGGIPGIKLLLLMAAGLLAALATQPVAEFLESHDSLSSFFMLVGACVDWSVYTTAHDSPMADNERLEIGTIIVLTGFFFILLLPFEDVFRRFLRLK